MYNSEHHPATLLRFCGFGAVTQASVT